MMWERRRGGERMGRVGDVAVDELNLRVWTMGRLPVGPCELPELSSLVVVFVGRPKSSPSSRSNKSFKTPSLLSSSLRLASSKRDNPRTLIPSWSVGEKESKSLLVPSGS